MIRLVDVCKSFGDKEALHHINLTIEDGETLAIIGGSGSGKSTLLRLLIGLIRPTSGEIWIGDTEISQLSEEQLDKVRLHMGMVFQYSALFDSMTVGDNVALVSGNIRICRRKKSSALSRRNSIWWDSRM
jgi:phospholipid/cholesterol/gamma-HCH transport system ATP-binding protein